MNIPIYRAKKIDSDEYVEGQLVIDSVGQTIIIQDCVIYGDLKADNVWQQGVYNSFNFIVDATTLAIHFPDTNIKDLFFGIDNGKGASIIEALFIDDNTPFKGFAMHTHYGYVFYDKNDDWVHITKLKGIKVIGIQE